MIELDQYKSLFAFSAQGVKSPSKQVKSKINLINSILYMECGFL